MIYMFKVALYYLLMYLRNFRNKCIEIYELDPAQFLSDPGLT